MLPALTLCGCIWSPKPEQAVQLDTPPFIDPDFVVPAIGTTQTVNLQDTEGRQLTFSANRIFDWDRDDNIEYVWVFDFGNGTPITRPAGGQTNIALGTTAAADASRTSFRTDPIDFDPCDFDAVLAGLTESATIELILLDEIPQEQRADEGERSEWQVSAQWTVRFEGQCTTAR